MSAFEGYPAFCEAGVRHGFYILIAKWVWSRFGGGPNYFQKRAELFECITGGRDEEEWELLAAS